MDVFQRICGNGEEEEEIIHFYVPEDHSVPGLCGNRGIRVEYVTHTPRHLESPLAATARAGGSFNVGVCITKTEKAESEAQRGKPKGTLESESRNAIV